MKTLAELTNANLYEVTVNWSLGIVESFTVELTGLEKKLFKSMFKACANKGLTVKLEETDYDKDIPVLSLDDLIDAMELDEYLIPKEVKVEIPLVETMRKYGFAAYKSEYMCRTRAFVKVNSLKELPQVMSVITNECPKLKLDDIYMGTNCIFVYEEDLFYKDIEDGPTVSILDEEKVNKFIENY